MKTTSPGPYPTRWEGGNSAFALTFPMRWEGQDAWPGESKGTGPSDALIVAVAQRDFLPMGAAALRALGKPKWVLYDVKAMLRAEQVDGRF